jgi:hypothetical protein
MARYYQHQLSMRSLVSNTLVMDASPVFLILVKWVQIPNIFLDFFIPNLFNLKLF